MIAPPLRLLQRQRAVFVRGVQSHESYPDFGEVERGYVLDDRVASIYRDGASPLEVSPRFVEVSDLGVENSPVIQHPRHGLGAARHFECAEAPGIERGGPAEIAAHARQDPAILFDHAEKSRVTGSLGKF